ncbi:MAG: phosphoglycerate dehydrogenase [Wenzhouxiangellaceae bacterium]|nr:phosphoglycerate dehydrogenase [Wenzhouxiangellaceae bacterium]
MNQTRHSLAKDRIRIVLLEGVHESAVAAFRAASYSNIEQLPAALPTEQLIEKVADCHFLGIRSRTRLTERVLEAAPRLAAVACFCIGTDQVDLAAARQRGIPVFNAPYANTRSVAELVLAEIVMLMRGIPAKNAACHRGRWLKSAKGAFEVRGKTLGIVGYGHIGSQLGILAEGLGMRVIYHDIVRKLPLGNAQAVDSLDTLLARSDVVSMHVPDTPQTRGMIDAAELAGMKPGSHLINAARGKVVSIPALAAALESGHLGGAAIDVFPSEPASKDDEFISELREFDNVLLTPHIGGSTVEAQENIAIDAATKLIHYSDNGSTAGAVNFPEVNLPDHATARRILHIHRNEPGVLQAINNVFSSAGINIASQYLQTLPDVGYVVMDVETDDAGTVLEGLKAIPATIRSRYLK